MDLVILPWENPWNFQRKWPLESLRHLQSKVPRPDPMEFPDPTQPDQRVQASQLANRKKLQTSGTTSTSTQLVASIEKLSN